MSLDVIVKKFVYLDTNDEFFVFKREHFVEIYNQVSLINWNGYISDDTNFKNFRTNIYLTLDKPVPKIKIYNLKFPVWISKKKVFFLNDLRCLKLARSSFQMATQCKL